MAPTVTQVLGVAASQLGIKEPGWDTTPGGQVTKYSRWYVNWSHQTGYLDTYWCAMFASWCLATAGFGVTEAGRFGNCNPWIRWWKTQGRWAARTHPVPGAVVFYDWDGDGAAEHVGFVEKVLPDGRLQTLEGNATVGGGAHDGVYRMKRTRSYVLGYGLPPYATTAVRPAASTPASPASRRLPGPIVIAAAGGHYGTADARVVPWAQCPQMARGFGGPENPAQRAWAAYWYRLMGTFSPGYFRTITATPAGRAEVTRAEIGPATVGAAERMFRQLHPGAAAWRGVIPADAWRVYQPGTV